MKHDNSAPTDWLNEKEIFDALNHGANSQAPSRAQIDEIIAKSFELKGLSFSDVALLCRVESDELLAPIFSAAKKVKEAIYGRRIVLFAPLYISNLCANECLYCAFRVSNKLLTRRALSMAEIAEETKTSVMAKIREQQEKTKNIEPTAPEKKPLSLCPCREM